MNTTLTDNHMVLHGVFVDVLGMGVLLSGRSGIGKSEFALGLIDRGHRLVSDDSVWVELSEDAKELVGRAPPLLQDFLEVRGLGVLNIRVLFGDTAIKSSKPLQFIVNIIQISDKELHDIDRLHGINRTRNILGIEIPEVSIPLAPGRNLAILIESAVRNHMLKLTGYHSSVEFEQRHLDYMQLLTNESDKS